MKDLDRDAGLLTLVEKAIEKYGSQRQAAQALGLSHGKVQRILKKGKAEPRIEQDPAGMTPLETELLASVREARQHAEKTAKEEPPVFTARQPKAPRIVAPSRRIRRFIFSAAQNNTEIHEGFLVNLEAYARHLNAEIHIAGFTYGKRLFEEHAKTAVAWHPRIERYITNRQFVIGDDLVFCGEMNTLPTATQPLSGFETYTRHRSGIFPHAKVQLVSVPTLKGTKPKILMTSGAVTLPNYVAKRAGIKAHFHHVLGAVLVEVDEAGDHFCRHLLAEDDGAFQDLTHRVEGGVVTSGHRIEALTPGDIHFEQLDPQVARTIWGIDAETLVTLPGPTSMIDALRPKYQFIHDLTDFTVRNHHNLKDPHFRLRMHYAGTDSVSTSFEKVAGFLFAAWREGCETVVVESNHDLAVLRWLKEADWRQDPVNAEFHLRAQLALLESIREGQERFSVLEWAMRDQGAAEDAFAFLREDDSFTICQGEIECAIHGHLGANGARGTPRQFTKMGPKANTAHTHSASIHDGIYTAGTSSKLDLKYNRGLSSWSHSSIATYPSGKRAILTIANGKWCADHACQAINAVESK